MINTSKNFPQVKVVKNILETVTAVTTNATVSETPAVNPVITPVRKTSVTAETAKSKGVENNFDVTKQPVPYIDPRTNPDRYPEDDLGRGYLFADTFETNLCYVKDSKMWFYYDGCRWRADTGGVIARQYAKVLLELLKKGNNETFAEMLSKRTRRETMLKEAQDCLAVELSQFDRDPYILNCLNGTLDSTRCKAFTKARCQQ